MTNPPLEEQFYVTDAMRLRRWLPWLHLFRAFRMAIGIRPLMLGCLSLLLLVAGTHLIAHLPYAADWAIGTGPEVSTALMWTDPSELAIQWRDITTEPLQTLSGTLRHPEIVLSALCSHLPASRHLFQAGASWSDLATSCLLLLWTLAVWSISGVAIARLAALEFAQQRSSGLIPALQFGITRLSASLGSQLLPLLGVACLWLVCLVGGAIGRIPIVGLPIVGALWWLALLCGLGMAIILLLLAVGWPLMLTAVAVEDTEGFDAFSRVYSYLTSRPWYALWLAVLAMLYGSALIVVVATLLETAHSLAEAAVVQTLGEDRFGELTRQSVAREFAFAPKAVQFWREAWRLLIAGFVASFFWTSVTIVYFLLHRASTRLRSIIASLP